MRSLSKFGLVSSLMLVLAGCERYAQRPLYGEQILAGVERQRHFPDSTSSVNLPVAGISQTAPPVPFTFVRGVELTKTHSPTLKEVRAEYETAQALSLVKTPFPNPAFEAGPQYGFGPKVSHLYRLQPFGSLSFAIPTGQRLKRQDELNFALAGLACVETQARHRELYMELRKDFTRLALGKQRIAKRNQLIESAAKSTVLSKKLIEAGVSTELDTGLLELEQYKLKAEVLTAQTDLIGVEGELSQLIGVSTDQLTGQPEDDLPKLPDAVPPLAELQRMLVNNHPELARLRAKYEVAERQLHLELAKQYPDFKLGTTYDHERGEQKTTIGLGLGIDIPLFDRNQQAIATAKQKREQIRTKYEAAANRSLAVVERAYRTYQLSSERLKLLNTLVLPRANKNIELARKALETGQSDTLRFLETERGQRTVLLDALEAELSVRSAWIEIEQAVGYPLTTFPNESLSDTPPLEAPAN
jgi:cobalt-zinc-cadmium efflux system outer membrane protein